MAIERRSEVARNLVSTIRWVAFDLDGTLTRYSSMAAIAKATGYGAIAKRLTADYRAGVRTNTEVSNEYAEILQHILDRHSEHDLRAVLDSVDLVDGIADVVAELKTRSVGCGISTVTFDFIAEYFSKRFGFERYWASTLKRDDANRLTAQIDTVLESADKLRLLEEFCLERDLDLSQVAFVGDGRSDVDVMRRVGLSIAFNADDDARSVACLDVTASRLTSIFSQDHRFSCDSSGRGSCAHTETLPWLPGAPVVTRDTPVGALT